MKESLCDKCGGLVLFDGEEIKCVNCAKRFQRALQERGSMATCTKKTCGEEAADDSVMCPHHRDQKRAMNAKYNGREVPTTKRAYTKRTNGTPAVVATNGHLTLDAAIERLEKDLEALRRAKLIIMAH